MLSPLPALACRQPRVCSHSFLCRSGHAEREQRSSCVCASTCVPGSQRQELQEAAAGSVRDQLCRERGRRKPLAAFRSQCRGRPEHHHAHGVAQARVPAHTVGAQPARAVSALAQALQVPKISIILFVVHSFSQSFHFVSVQAAVFSVSLSRSPR